MEILVLTFVSFLPIFELRLAIPIGIIVLGLNPFLVFFVSCVANVLAAIFAYYLIDFAIFVARKIPFLNKIYEKKVIKIQTKIRPQVEKYGWFALALFIGVPVPGSGVYTGALGAKVVDMKFKEFFYSALLGVLFAGVIVAIISVFFSEALNMIGFNTHKIELFERLFTR